MSSLKARGINGDKAVRCCRYNSLRTEQTVLNLLGQTLDAATDAREKGDYSSQIAMVPLAGGGIEPATRFLSDFERLIQKGSASDFERLLQRPVNPQFRIVRAAVGGPLAVGAIVLIGSSALSSIRAQTATIETLTGVVELLDKVKLKNDCESCIKRALWNQKHPQVKTPGFTRKRVSGQPGAKKSPVPPQKKEKAPEPKKRPAQKGNPFPRKK